MDTFFHFNNVIVPIGMIDDQKIVERAQALVWADFVLNQYT